MKRTIAAALIAALFFAAVHLSVSAVQAQVVDPRVADLSKTGKIRVGLFVPQFIKDHVTGELRGVWAESARALASKIGTQIELIEHATPPEAVACLKAGGCDLLFLPLDDRAASIGDFSPPIFQSGRQFGPSPMPTGPAFASRRSATMPQPTSLAAD
jgi:ABC-type amino acid transport substrate-binding protein